MTAITMLAPSANLVFASLPSGSSYISDEYALIHLTNGSVADQRALMAAGCVTLNTVTGVAGTPSIGFPSLANLYSADTSYGYGFGTLAAVLNDVGAPSNNGTWTKTGTGAGLGNWTQAYVSPQSFDDPQVRFLLKRLRNLSNPIVLMELDSITDGSHGFNFRTVFNAAGRAAHGYGGLLLPLSYPACSDYGTTFQISSGVNYIDVDASPETGASYAPYTLNGEGLYVASGDGTPYWLLGPAGAWTTVRLWYLKQPGGGSFTVGPWASVDLGTPQTINTSSASLSIGYVDVAYPANQTGQVDLHVYNVTGNVAWSHVLFQNGSTGFISGNLAKGGRLLHTIASLNASFQQQHFANLAAVGRPIIDLINGGMNDRVSYDHNVHYSDLTTVVTNRKTGAPNIAIVIVQSPEPPDAATTNFNSYVPVKVQVAKEQGTAYLDCRWAFLDFASALANGLMYGANDVHPSSLGFDVIGNLQADLLGFPRGLNDPGLTAYPAPPSTGYQYTVALSHKHSESVAAGSPTTLWTIGLTNGYPTALLTVQVYANRAGSTTALKREFYVPLSNYAAVNQVRQVGSVATKLIRASDNPGNGEMLDVGLTVTLTGNKAVVTFTPTFTTGYSAGGITFSGTGNGTMSGTSGSPFQGTMSGNYKATCMGNTSSNGAFMVTKPDGSFDGVAKVGTAYAGTVSFTIAAGSTAFVPGDTFTIPMTASTETSSAVQYSATATVEFYTLTVQGQSVFEN